MILLFLLPPAVRIDSRSQRHGARCRRWGLGTRERLLSRGGRCTAEMRRVATRSRRRMHRSAYPIRLGRVDRIVHRRLYLPIRGYRPRSVIRGARTRVGTRIPIPRHRCANRSGSRRPRLLELGLHHPDLRLEGGHLFLEFRLTILKSS